MSILAPPVKVKKQNGQAVNMQGPIADDPNRFCSICKASFNNPLMAQQHYVGKKHKKHLTKQKLMETFGPSPTPGQFWTSMDLFPSTMYLSIIADMLMLFISPPASTIKGYPCTVCNIELNSVEQYQAHVSGAKHNNKYVLKYEP